MLNELKTLLGIDRDSTDLDTKLNWILEAVKSRLKILLGGIDPPEEMNHIVIEVAVIRFNRIGSEGLSSHSVEGESLSFYDNDFSGFMDEIQAFLDTESCAAKKGGFRFI